ncbi:MAG: caspase family protein [Candidatus Rokuibacteriota bacterium]
MVKVRRIPTALLSALTLLALLLGDATVPDRAFAPDVGGGGGGGEGGGGGGEGGGGNVVDQPFGSRRSFTDWSDSPQQAAPADTAPPRITVAAPPGLEAAGEVTVVGAETRVSGAVTDSSRVTRFLLNGKAVQLDFRSRFNETIRLAPGKNVLALTAIDEHGNRADATYTILREAPQPVSTPPEPGLPRIAMIDPPVDLTRDNPSVRVGAIPDLDLIGQVTAPAGVLQVKVNDRAAAVNENGVFRVPVTLGGRATPIHIVAIDGRGRRTVVEFTLMRDPTTGEAPASKTATPSVAAAPAPRRPAIDFGRYHALVIGNNTYQHLRPLETAVSDATAIANLLETEYGYTVTLQLNATREDMVVALDKLRATLTHRDNLLIYYAGHGVLDRDAGRGYWLPVTARPDTRAQWLSNTEITDTLKAMTAKHVLVVADSCYSGALFRDAERGITLTTGIERDAYLARLAEKRARTVLSSGGLEPVLDSGGGQHSVFAKALLAALRENRDVLDGQGVFAKIRRPVVLNSPQTPEYSDIRFAGHDGGDFLFVRR